MEPKHAKVVDSGIVWRKPDHVFGYAAWPTVCKDSQGNLVVAFSGNRIMHICPFAKCMLIRSKDEGKTWSSPIIAIDTPLDDRDPGILHMGGGKMLMVSMNNTRAVQLPNIGKYGSAERSAMVAPYLENITDQVEEKYYGFSVSISEDDGYTWSEPIRTPVFAPRGPSLRKDGTILYAGWPAIKDDSDTEICPVWVYTSKDGRTYDLLAEIPENPELPQSRYSYSEPHILELPSGRLILHVRVDEPGKPYTERCFILAQTISDDGGNTWSPLKPLNRHGAPPHLLQHSSGALISACGRRCEPYGIQAMISYDEGETWDMDYFLQIAGENPDMGYPCSAELDNGDIFTVFYRKETAIDMASLYYVRWKLPEKG